MDTSDSVLTRLNIPVQTTLPDSVLSPKAAKSRGFNTVGRQNSYVASDVDEFIDMEVYPTLNSLYEILHKRDLDVYNLAIEVDKIASIITDRDQLITQLQAELTQAGYGDSDNDPELEGALDKVTQLQAENESLKQQLAQGNTQAPTTPIVTTDDTEQVATLTAQIDELNNYIDTVEPYVAIAQTLLDQGVIDESGNLLQTVPSTPTEEPFIAQDANSEETTDDYTPAPVPVDEYYEDDTTTPVSDDAYTDQDTVSYDDDTVYEDDETYADEPVATNSDYGYAEDNDAYDTDDQFVYEENDQNNYYDENAEYDPNATYDDSTYSDDDNYVENNTGYADPATVQQDENYYDDQQSDVDYTEDDTENTYTEPSFDTSFAGDDDETDTYEEEDTPVIAPEPELSTPEIEADDEEEEEGQFYNGKRLPKGVRLDDLL